MTEPLIDPTELRRAVFATETGRTLDERLLDYLRSVLTPDVLCVNDLYRRVFGDDQ